MYNPSIAALDFSNEHGRVVRARHGAVVAVDVSGKRQPMLFVDGVEGSNSIAPAVIKQAIEEYARAAGCVAVVYGPHSHNKVPQRFVEHVRRTGVMLSRVPMAYLDSTKREYLDAFGFPLAPFENAKPAGSTLGYVVPVQPGYAPAFEPPHWYDKALGWVRRNILLGVVAQATLFGILTTIQINPLVAVGLAAFVAAGVAYDRRFQHRSLRTDKL